MAAKPKPPGALSKQVGGSHYKTGGVQHVTFCQRNRIPWCEASAIKYITRHRRKNGREDLEKAKHYLELMLECEYADGKLVEHPRMIPEVFRISAYRFCEDNKIYGHEVEWVMKVLSHQVDPNGFASITKLISAIQSFIDDYDSLMLL